ncbi:aldo/keto reductase family domain-containing protein [Trichoderma breve]|uniref:Aldo/keto reductase family domain-containing protein n=1 Tax=Trichoderma breve TaxID=2034170 RepID=A0A9W9E3Z0_9HYPO|nr:aldo/keto reductase family domain-containing protein [Trichoderma breve]KAJ4855712.1 aldo/keto reductase family domain-containing protein [Trichoderma breve]
MPAHLIFGAGGVGHTKDSFTFTWDTPEKVSELLSSLKRLNLPELDSAAVYPPGNPGHTEILLGQAKAADQGFTIDSKVFIREPGKNLTDANISSSIDNTLASIGTDHVRTLYAHFPDSGTPLEVTAAAFDKQYKAGKYKQLGLSNFSFEDVVKYFQICEEKGYIKPSVYQGHYNALARSDEKDLIPFLRKHDCVYNAYRPAMHDAIRKLKAACDSTSPPLTLQEAALRWIVNHSALGDGDGVIVGAKRVDQLESNVKDARAGSLPEHVRETIEGLWSEVDID